jgi:hypothetical protein
MGTAGQRFDEACQYAMRRQWDELAQIVVEYPEVCAVRVPRTAPRGAGYTLMLTLVPHGTPDAVMRFQR